MHLLEISVQFFLCPFGAFKVQLGAIWVLLKDMVCPWENVFRKDGTVEICSRQLIKMPFNAKGRRVGEGFFFCPN